MLILGISAFYHDSAAALIEDQNILAAAQEERFSRKKHDPSFPFNAILFCLTLNGVSIDQLDAVVFYDKPLLKFERLLETYYAFAPRGLRSFLAAIPVWIKEKLMLKKLILDELGRIESFNKKKIRLLFPEHHLSHAASAFYPSPFEESAILSIDGGGEWATTSICQGKGNRIKILRELRFPHSVGLLYSAFTYYLGFKVNSGEYKLMGLAPYGNPSSEQTARFAEIIKRELVDIKDDGSVYLNQDYFDYATGLRMAKDHKWETLFGFPARQPEGDLLSEHCDLALAIQQVSEEIILKMAQEAKRLTGSKNLCLAGGVALNCVANGKLLRQQLFDDIWIQPAAGDAGGALGAAYAAYHIYFNHERKTDSVQDKMKGSYLGPQFSDTDIRQAVIKWKAVFIYYEDFDTLCGKVAEFLDGGNVVGWFQERMEWGPRALGNRSILADPRNPAMQKKLNLKIKFREGFRPFAPSVLTEDAADFFDVDSSSPYMLLIADVKEPRRKTLPENYYSLPWRDKLYHLRSDVPAITHIDYTARLQTVHKETNPKYWQLIKRFKDRTGYGVIINTSFNVRGEPIVCSPDDAYRCFMRTEMDYLVMGNCLFDKRDQPEWIERSDWKQTYGLD
jgi:carbamoyltransferase